MLYFIMLLLIIVILLFPTISYAEGHLSFNASNEAIVDIRVVNASGNTIVKGKGYVIDREGLIATEIGMIQRWFEKIQNDLIVRIKDKDFSIYRLITYNKQLNLAVFKIDIDSLPALALPSDERLARYIKRVIKIYKDMVKNSKTIKESGPDLSLSRWSGTENVQNTSHLLKRLNYASSNRYEEAIEEYIRALKTDPFNPEIYNCLGLAYYKIGRYRESIEAYNKALMYGQGSRAIYDKLGTLYLIMGEYDRAIVTFEKALSLNGNDPMSRFNHAIALFMNGDRELAWQDYIVLRGLDEELARRLWDIIN